MKRAPGTGQVDQLPSGRFRARLVIEGRRVTIGTWLDEATAHRELDAAATAAATKGAHLDRSDSLARYGERVIARASIAGVSTAEVDRYVWQAHVVGSAIGARPVGSVTADDLRRFFDGLRSSGLRSSTARSYVAAIRRVLREAQSEHLIGSVPALRVPRARRSAEPAAWTFLEPGEQDRLLAGAPSPARCVVAFALYTGLRAGELVTLRLADVRPDGVVVRYGRVPDGPTKTGRVRVVPWIPAAREWWERWLVVRPASASPLAFPAPRGGFRLPNSTLGFNTHQRDWRAMLAEAGVNRRVRWHDLRHTCASSLVAGWWGRVWTLDEVRDFLGHSSIQTTERYAHLAPARLAAVAAETRPTARPTEDVPESLAALSRNGMRAVGGVATASFPWRGNSQGTAGGYERSWVERGAEILQRLAASDATAIEPARDLVREVVAARRLVDPFELAAEGDLSRVIDALGVLVQGGAAVRRAEGR